ncbi:MAG TPA: hypothetical protein VN738_08275, partial [Acidothermaceae bacterium]|nr:hypothetical protein [Acidothermaceae bacterium]
MTGTRLSLVFVAALWLAGCASPPQKDAATPTADPAAANSEKTLQVNRLRLEFAAAFMPGRPELSPTEASKLQA